MFVPKGPINNIPALVQIMAWPRSGYKPLSEPMLVSSLMHIRRSTLLSKTNSDYITRGYDVCYITCAGDVWHSIDQLIDLSIYVPTTPFAHEISRMHHH